MTNLAAIVWLDLNLPDTAEYPGSDPCQRARLLLRHGPDVGLAVRARQGDGVDAKVNGHVSFDVRCRWHVSGTGWMEVGWQLRIHALR